MQNERLRSEPDPGDKGGDGMTRCSLSQNGARICCLDGRRLDECRPLEVMKLTEMTEQRINDCSQTRFRSSLYQGNQQMRRRYLKSVGCLKMMGSSRQRSALYISPR